MQHGDFHAVRRSVEKVEEGRFSFSTIIFDQVSYIIGALVSLFNIPQLYRIWSEKSAAGVSLLAWFGFAAGSLFWFAYAKHNKEKTLVFTFGLTLFFQICIIISILLFR